MSRFAFQSKVEKAIAATQPGDSGLSAFLLIDIDRFGDMNRLLGHRKGDRVLKAVADWLSAQIRDSEQLARHDGARFAIWMSDASQRVEALQLAQRLVTLSAVVVDGQTLPVSLSIGLALFPDHGLDQDSLLAQASAALALAKSNGGGQVRIANAKLPDIPNAWLTQNQLTDAIGRDKLKLFYQPVFSVKSRRPVAMEALLRPQIDALAGTSTEQILDLAERLPVIEDLTRWGLRSALQAAAKIYRERSTKHGTAGPAISVAVNLPSGILQSRSFDRWVAEAIAEAQLPAHLLTLEITERSRFDQSMLHTLHRLREIGCELAIDDFGIGYSSLERLTQLPVQKVKFDRSLLPSGASTNSYVDRPTILMRHLLGLVHDLGMTAVSEGVETESQFAGLALLGCDYAQGYLLAKPMPEEQLADFFASLPA